jgi:polyisoprenoid-binding protein YceI
VNDPGRVHESTETLGVEDEHLGPEPSPFADRVRRRAHDGHDGHGQFRKVTAAVDFDEADPERSTVEAHIDASTIDTGMEARDAHLKSADCFDAGSYPELVFRSTHIERSGDGYRIQGDLTIRGET